MDRLTAVRERFDSFIMDDLHAAVATPSADAWHALGIPVRYRVSGWMYPLPYTRPADGQDTLLISVCPEVIVEHTADLDDNDFDVYLSVTELMLSTHVANYPSNDPADPGIAAPADRERVAEDLLYDTNPEALGLFSRVQMAALDNLQGDSDDRTDD